MSAKTEALELVAKEAIKLGPVLGIPKLVTACIKAVKDGVQPSFITKLWKGIGWLIPASLVVWLGGEAIDNVGQGLNSIVSPVLILGAVALVGVVVYKTL